MQNRHVMGTPVACYVSTHWFVPFGTPSLWLAALCHTLFVVLIPDLLWRVLLGWLGFAGQGIGFDADLSAHYLVIFGLAQAQQVFIEPANNVLQTFNAVPGLTGTGKLVRFAWKTHHDDWLLQELE